MATTQNSPSSSPTSLQQPPLTTTQAKQSLTLNTTATMPHTMERSGAAAFTTNSSTPSQPISSGSSTAPTPTLTATTPTSVPATPTSPVAPPGTIYCAVYSGVPVYECIIRDIAVMKRRPDSYLNATQILKVAGLEKGKRTKIIEKEVLTGDHEKVQGGYGKYQGTWVPYERGKELAQQYGVMELMRPLIEYKPPRSEPSSYSYSQSQPSVDREAKEQLLKDQFARETAVKVQQVKEQLAKEQQERDERERRERIEKARREKERQDQLRVEQERQELEQRKRHDEFLRQELIRKQLELERKEREEQERKHLERERREREEEQRRRQEELERKEREEEEQRKHQEFERKEEQRKRQEELERLNCEHKEYEEREQRKRQEELERLEYERKELEERERKERERFKQLEQEGLEFEHPLSEPPTEGEKGNAPPQHISLTTEVGQADKEEELSRIESYDITRLTTDNNLQEILHREQEQQEQESRVREQQLINSRLRQPSLAILNHTPSSPGTFNNAPSSGTNSILYQASTAEHIESSNPSAIEIKEMNTESHRAILMSIFLNDDINEVPKFLSSQSTPPDFEINMVIDNQGHTALHWAATLARTPVLELLLTKGADVNQTNYDGESALIRSVLATNNYEARTFPTVVDMLQATIPATDHHNRTVFHHIAMTSGTKGYCESAEYYMECLGHWIEKNADGNLSTILNIQDKNGDTALNIASRVGNANIVRQLETLGASRDIENKIGLKAVDFEAALLMDIDATADAHLSPHLDSHNIVNGTSKNHRKRGREVITALQKMVDDMEDDYIAQLQEWDDKITNTRALLNDRHRVLNEAGRRLQYYRHLEKDLLEAEKTAENLERALQQQKEENGEFDSRKHTKHKHSNGDYYPSLSNPFVIQSSRVANTSLVELAVPAKTEITLSVPMTTTAGITSITKQIPVTLGETNGAVTSTYNSNTSNLIASLANASPTAVEYKQLTAQLFAYEIEEVEMMNQIEKLNRSTNEAEEQYKQIIASCCQVNVEEVNSYYVEKLMQALESDGKNLDLERVRNLMSMDEDDEL